MFSLFNRPRILDEIDLKHAIGCAGLSVVSTAANM